MDDAQTRSEPPATPGKAKRRRKRKRAGAETSGAERPENGLRVPPVVPPSAVHAGPEETARRALAELDRLVAQVGRELGVVLARGEAGEGHEVMIPLAAPLGGPGDVARRVQTLLSDVRERVGALAASATSFREGHVYCFHTDQPESPYSQPPHATDVFAGFAPTGRPEWIGFASLLMAKKEPRVDRLFGGAPEVLAFVQTADELDHGMLPGFGRGSLVWKLLGQVVLGLVPADLDPRSRAERVALSLQIIETSQPGLKHRLRLNVIGLPPEAIAQAAAEQPEHSAAEAFRRMLRATRGRVDALGRRAALAHRQGEALELAPHVTALLARLRGDVLRVLKARDYRTRHAQERHASGERPTSLAIADALAASDGRFFRDEHKGTIVVLGPKHRVHVFSPSGRHVTSLELQPAEVERRLELKRWRFLERVGSELFKDALRKSLSPDDEPAGPRS